MRDRARDNRDREYKTECEILFGSRHLTRFFFSANLKFRLSPGETSIRRQRFRSLLYNFMYREGRDSLCQSQVKG